MLPFNSETTWRKQTGVWVLQFYSGVSVADQMRAGADLGVSRDEPSHPIAFGRVTVLRQRRGDEISRGDMRGEPCLEVVPLHPQERARRGLQVHAAQTRGTRVVSITEHDDDSPTGGLIEVIIESVDEFCCENLMPEVQSRQTLPSARPV